MDTDSENTPRRLCLGLLAHVDAGKTTLSEALLYESGAIRKLGRVDHRDAFLDTDAMERERGITIFSKQAVLSAGDLEITLLDTPGHVDFSAETERTLRVLDCALLVISGTDGVQGHTRTLWRLLERYGIPVFLFVNKMDLASAGNLLAQLKSQLDGGCVDFGGPDFLEEAAVCDEAALEVFGNGDALRRGDLRSRPPPPSFPLLFWLRPEAGGRGRPSAGPGAIRPYPLLPGRVRGPGIQNRPGQPRRAAGLSKSHRRHAAGEGSPH